MEQISRLKDENAALRDEVAAARDDLEILEEVAQVRAALKCRIKESSFALSTVSCPNLQISHLQSVYTHLNRRSSRSGKRPKTAVSSSALLECTRMQNSCMGHGMGVVLDILTLLYMVVDVLSLLTITVHM